MNSMRTILSLCFTLVSYVAFAQGAWDIMYYPADSLSPSLIGKNIRLDFKSSPSDAINKKRPLNVRQLLSSRDTVVLTIDNRKVKFIESWTLYVDHGVVRDQTLRSSKLEFEKEMLIKEMYLKAIDESTVTLEMYFYYCDSPQVLQSKQDVVIEKSTIKGILVELDR